MTTYFLCKIINQIPDQENNNNLKHDQTLKNYIEKNFLNIRMLLAKKKFFNSNIICRRCYHHLFMS